MPKSQPKANWDDEIIEDLGRFSNDPYSFVLWAFDWGVGELEGKQPEAWQVKVLKEIRDGLKTVNQVIQEAVASGHGVGKSALVSWLILWSISTFEDTRGVVTANTDGQLKTKTWPELGKWHRLFIAKHLFHFTATSIYSTDQDHEKNWRIDAVPWSINNTEAFAGLHNQGKRIIVIFDEASGIDDPIFEVTEGALTDKDTQIIWCVFGNRTRNSGRFRECFKSQVKMWKTHCVDSREVSFTNKDKIQQWKDFHGEDSDFFRVRVRGLEPNASTLQLIGNDIIEQAYGRALGESQYHWAPKIITVDAAWEGGDETVIGLRQGLAFKILKVFPKNDDDTRMAGEIARYEDEENADAVFIDFGYGTGIFSAGKSLNRKDWVLVKFGGKPDDDRFANKRTEIWYNMKTWLADGGSIPKDPVLSAELSGPEIYTINSGPNTGKLLLESKEDMKERGLTSPNRGDCLAISFAFPVKKKDTFKRQGNNSVSQRDYDPLEEMNQSPKNSHATYDPMGSL